MTVRRSRDRSRHLRPGEGPLSGRTPTAPRLAAKLRHAIAPPNDFCSIEAVGKLGNGYNGGAPARWKLAEEVPVEILFNGSSGMVMMATPADLEDYAVGFSVTEEIVPSASAIRDITIVELADGFAVDVETDPVRVNGQRLGERGIAGRTGCGLCGVKTIAEAVRQPKRVARRIAIAHDAVAAALSALPTWQPMNRDNRSVHAAAWCDVSGEIGEAREDVGRHNALDKLIGALLRTGRDPADGFIVMSSRCSFELVQKAAVIGVSYLATVSAPTSLALSLAESCGMRLASGAPEGIIEFDPESPRT